MKIHRHFAWLLLLASSFVPARLFAQIDPYRRDLLQLGYNAAFEGHAPLAAYAFYYRNQPNFYHTNLTLRLAIAPTYLDSELGISRLLGEHTDLGIGLAGGGFADSYAEIRHGQYMPDESFTGHGAEASVSVYHLFNPDRLIPLSGMLRGIAHYSVYERDDSTASNFHIVDDHGTFSVRTGLRWGGKEPTLYPDLAMELSIWYQGEFRNENQTYGYGDRKMEANSHLFWGEALIAYTLPELKHNIFLTLTAGTSVDADRFSAYRLGGLLPFSAEYPLSLPGYYYQEISAKNFVLFGGNYILPLDRHQQWNLTFTAATAAVEYIDGLEQPGNWHSGLGAGVLYRSSTWRVMAGYAYGVDAMRSEGRGANSIGMLLQLDLGKAKEHMFNPAEPNRWRGFQRMFGLFGE